MFLFGLKHPRVRSLSYDLRSLLGWLACGFISPSFVKFWRPKPNSWRWGQDVCMFMVSFYAHSYTFSDAVHVDWLEHPWDEVLFNNSWIQAWSVWLSASILLWNPSGLWHANPNDVIFIGILLLALWKVSFMPRVLTLATKPGAAVSSMRMMSVVICGFGWSVQSHFCRLSMEAINILWKVCWVWGEKKKKK